METTLPQIQFNEEQLQKLCETFRKFGEWMDETITAIAKFINNVIDAFVKTFRDVIFGLAPPKVVRLALYHKSERVRKKNWARIYKIWQRALKE